MLHVPLLDSDLERCETLSSMTSTKSDTIPPSKLTTVEHRSPNKVTQTGDSSILSIVCINIYCVALTATSSLIKVLQSRGISIITYQTFRSLSLLTVMSMYMYSRGLNPLNLVKASETRKPSRTLLLLILRGIFG